MGKSGRLRSRASSREDKRVPSFEPPGDGGPDETAALIAENVRVLAWLARRDRLDLLVHLLGMVQMEAEDRLLLRSKHKLS